MSLQKIIFNFVLLFSVLSSAGQKEMQLTNLDDYFKYVDLDAIYLGDALNGAPSLFVATMYDLNGDGTFETPVMALYFKESYGISPSAPYDDNAPARPFYTCKIADDELIAKIDVTRINGAVLTKSYSAATSQVEALQQLSDYIAGFRVIDLNNITGQQNYFGRCDAASKNILRQEAWRMNKTLTSLVWTDENDFNAGKKANLIKYAGFTFNKSNGVIANSNKLKDLYRKAGFIP